MKKPGDVNYHEQVLVKINDKSSTSHPYEKVWLLRCSLCGYEYGCNGADAWLRKCPECMAGKPGEPIT